MYETDQALRNKQIQNQDAQMLSSKFKDVRLRKKAYLDFTGINFAISGMQKKGLRISTQRSVFKCPKIYSDFEITDVYCNSHALYVLTSYGTEFVKVPAIHKQYNILPEAYLVVDVKIGMKEGQIKGVITPDELNNAQVSGSYYLFNVNRLKSVDSIVPVLKKYAGIKSSVGKHLECMNLFVPYIDDKLDFAAKQKLIVHILSCESCKKRLTDAVDFDLKSKNTEVRDKILSKEDISSKESFVKKLKSFGKEAPVQVQGAIDVIYEGHELTKIKDDAFKYKAEIPSKTRKLIVYTMIGVFLFFVVISLAFLIPPRERNLDENKIVQGELYTEPYAPNDEDMDDFDIIVPAIKKSGKYATVSKVSWEVSSDIENDNQKRFLQTAGKSIRLNLQNDLLLSNEAAVNSRVKFDVRFLRDGNLDTITVSESSGTNAVDEIIRQSIQNTLYYMHPPKGSFVGKKGALTLVVDF